MKYLLVFLTAGCSCLQPNPCTVYLRYDGGSPRPYYAVRECKGKPPVVLCDSPTRLPTPDCPPKEGDQ
jgi:hypothetical protein